MTPEEIITHLCRLKNFDDACEIALAFDLKLEPIFEALVVA